MPGIASVQEDFGTALASAGIDSGGFRYYEENYDNDALTEITRFGSAAFAAQVSRRQRHSKPHRLPVMRRYPRGTDKGPFLLFLRHPPGWASTS
jgi:hypothetical protein